MQTHRPLHIHPDSSIIFLTGRIYGGFSWLYPEATKQYFWDKLQELLPKYNLELDAHVICNNHYHLLLRVTQGNSLPKFAKHLHGSTAHYIKQNIPQFVNGEQILTREITAWDRRQTTRLNEQTDALERRLKSAITEDNKQAVIAQFIAHHKGVLAKLISPSERELKFATTDPKILVLLTAKDTPIWYQYMDHVARDEEDYYKHLNYIHQNPVKHGLVSKMPDYKWSSIHNWVKNHGKEYVIDSFRAYPIVDFEPVAE